MCGNSTDGSSPSLFQVYGLSVIQVKYKKEIYRQGASIGAGIAGGAAGGAIAGGICGPGSPICSGIGTLIGGAIGGIAAYQLVDAFDKELEAFIAWTVF